MTHEIPLPPKNRIEWIIWKDACADSSRVAVDSIKDVRLVTNANIGWAIHEDDERIVFAHGQSTGGEIDHFVIPTNCVIERRSVVASWQTRKPKPNPKAKDDETQKQDS
jgi:hypothetical protein